MGLAPDGGLFVPEKIPVLTEKDIAAFLPMTYAQRAAGILSLFLTDYTYEELLTDCEAAYCSDSFPGGPAPLVALRNDIHVLELWHGPTAAFKDMALQIMPRLLSRALRKTHEEKDALVLVATSGDTGKAALEGYKNVPHVKIQVYYPVDGVSRMQKLQMATQTGDNVDVVAVRGNFDDAQNGVKNIFSSSEMKKKAENAGYVFSSANSINWGRLAPQIAYYVSAYCDLVRDGQIAMGDAVNVCVPTGNFGNILAAYIAKRMGIPFRRLVCASNRNNVLTDFLSDGTYDRNRDFFTTSSPSMDILISSNLERLLWFVAGPAQTAQYMEALKKYGKYTVSEDVLSQIRQTFVGYYANENDTYKTISDFYQGEQYLIDPHTAVALSCALSFTGEEKPAEPMIVASTASPFKFANDVIRALGLTPESDSFLALEQLSAYAGVPIHRAINGLKNRNVRFDRVISPKDMPVSAFDWLR